MADQNQAVANVAEAKVEFRLHVLEKNNYIIWKTHTKNVLEAKGLVAAIEGELADSLREKQARALLTSALSSENQMKVINCDSAYKIWKRLEAIYENKSSFEKENLLNKLHSFKISSAREIPTAIGQMETIAAKLRLLGENISDDAMMSAILRALPKQFATFITVWRGSAASERTIENLLTRLMAEVDESETGEAALFTRRFRGSNRNAGSKNQRPPGRRNTQDPRDKDKCHHCGKTGHWKKDCWQLKNSQSPRQNPPRTNYRPPQQGQSRPNFNRQNRFRNQGRGQFRNQNRQEGNLRAFVASRVSISTWIVDSEASVHICPNIDWFREYREFSPSVDISLGDNSKMYALGVGNILTRQGILKRVYYVPEAANNLFSESSCAKNGIQILTLGHKKKFIDGRETIFEAQINPDGLYTLNLDIEPKQEVARTATLQEWHERFGHVSKRTIKEMARKRLVEGLVIEGVDDDDGCLECAMNKTQRLSHPIRTTPKVRSPGTVLHFDTVGPMPEESVGGARYFLLCKDEYSGFKMVHFIGHKSDVADKVKLCISQAQLDTGNQVLSIQTDNGTEFVNQHLSKYLHDRGIVHQTSVAYAPEQNGLIEREVRTVTEAGRTMLAQSGLSNALWAEAINTAVYTLNRTLFTRSGVTPFELWTGRKPSVKNFKCFGQGAVVLLPKRQRDKLDSKGIEMVFVGYTNLSNTYRFFSPDTGELAVSCDYKFLPPKKSTRPNSFGISTDAIQKQEVVYNEVDDAESDDSNSDTETESEQSESKPTPSEVKSPVKPRLSTSSDWQVALPYKSPILSGEATKSKPAQSRDQPKDETTSRNTGSKTEPRKSIAFDIPKNLFYRDKPPAIQPTKLRPRNDGQSTTVKPEVKKQEHAMLSTIEAEEDPASYEEAMRREDSEQWQIAMSDEIISLKKNQVWELVDKPEGVNIVTNRWVLRIKRRPDGSIERYKARLVARGFTQVHGVDYNETYSPVVNATSIRLLLAYAAKEELKIAQFDVKTAFLYGKLDEEIFMEQPEGFIEEEGKVCRLKRSLYGLKQAPRQWNKKFSDFLKAVNLRCLENDECIFYRKDPLLIIAIYVDDGIVFARNMNDVEQILKELKQEFEIHVVDSNAYLGFQIERLDSGRIAIHQTSYINKILKKFNMNDAIPVDAPVSISRVTGDSGEETLLAPDIPYREAIGSLMYAAVTTRIDIAYAVGKVSRKVASPSVQDWNDTMKIFRYLADKQDLAIIYDKDDTIGMHAYCDADFAGDDQTSKSTTGLVILDSGAPIHWRSSRQSLVTLSSTEAEVVSLCTTAKDIMWLRKIAEELDIIGPQAIPTLCDNQSAIKITTKKKSIQRTRHMSAQAAYVVEQVENKKVSISHVRSEDQVADMLTKPTTARKFAQNCSLLMTSLAILVMVAIRAANGLVLDRVAPVVWTETGKYVSTGVNDYDFELRFKNPCSILNDVAAVSIRRRKRSSGTGQVIQRAAGRQSSPMRSNNNQPALPAQGSQTRPAQQAAPNSQVAQAPQYPNVPQPGNVPIPAQQEYLHQNNQVMAPEKDIASAVTEAVRHCNFMYHQYIVNAIRQASMNFNPQEPSRYKRESREKRSPLLAGTIVGLFLSNILSIVKETWLHEKEVTDVEHRENIIETKLDNLNKQLNISSLILSSEDEALRSTTALAKHTQAELAEFVHTFPTLVSTTNFIVMKLLEIHEALSKLIFKTRTTKLDLWAMSVLVNENLFKNVDEDSAHISELTSPGPGVLKIKFAGRNYDNSTKVYRVESFKIWTNLTENPTLIEYVGERFLIHNRTNNCVRAINEPVQPFTTEVCSHKDGLDGNLARWQKVLSTSDPYTQPANTQYKTSWPYNYVYCWRLNITIDGETMKCPPYAFRLNATIAWNTSDTYVEAVKSIRKFELLEVNHDIHTVHFKNNEHLIDENEAFDKVRQLKVELERVQQENVAIKLPIQGGGLTYITSLKILSFLIILLIIVVALVVVYKHQRDTKRHHQVMRTVTDGIYGGGTYETIRRTKNNSAPAQINLNLTTTHSAESSRPPTVPARPQSTSRKHRESGRRFEKVYQAISDF